jgi:hypothetical protein
MSSTTIEDHGDKSTGWRIVAGGRGLVNANCTLDAESYVKTAREQRLTEGQAFMSSCYNIALADDAYLQMLVRTASTQRLYVFPEMSCGGDSLVEIYEFPTVPASGTSVVTYNRHRDIASAPDATFWHTPTISTSGTCLERAICPGALIWNSNQNIPIALSGTADYLFSLQNISGGAVPASIRMVYCQLLA